MYILSADTTAKTATVCIASDKDGCFSPISQINVNQTKTHSESLLPMIDSCLHFASLSLSDMDAFAISSSPGSFTGVRIGISAIKGLAFGMDKKVPCVPVSTLLALANNLCTCEDGTIICPLMDARREQFYNAFFEKKDGKIVRLCEDRLICASDLISEIKQSYADRKVIINGEGAHIFEKLAGGELSNLHMCFAEQLYQNAFSVAKCAYEEICAYSKEDIENAFSQEKLLPKYLRASQAEREFNKENKSDERL